MDEKTKAPPLFRHWPDDLVLIVNGRPVYKSDILEAKRERQARILASKRRRTEPIRVPCFVWTFNNGPIIPYGGWWLYVRTLRKDFRLDRDARMTPKVMALFPCGMEPSLDNYGEWKAAFGRKYARPTKKRPDDNGLAVATAVIDSSGYLLDIEERT